MFNYTVGSCEENKYRYDWLITRLLLRKSGVEAESTFVTTTNHLNFHYALIQSTLNALQQGHTIFTKIKLLEIIPLLQRSTDKKWKHLFNKV